MPGLSGLELQKRVAKDRAVMPIIFITGYGDIPMTVEAMKAGAVEFLTKPFTEEALLDAIATRSSEAAKRCVMKERRRCYATTSHRSPSGSGR